jgi:hypothetical protein
MDPVFDKFWKSLQQAGETLREQAAHFGTSAKEKSYETIEEWIQSFPKLEAYGLTIKSFALAAAISPALEVEFTGNHAEFPPERIREILEENKGNPVIQSVFNTIKTTYNLHRKIKLEFNDPLIVKVKVRLSPEIKVFIGEPLIV